MTLEELAEHLRIAFENVRDFPVFLFFLVFGSVFFVFVFFSCINFPGLIWQGHGIISHLERERKLLHVLNEQFLLNSNFLPSLQVFDDKAELLHGACNDLGK